MKKRHKALALLIGITVIVLLVVGAGFALLVNRPLKISQATFLYIDDNDNIDSVYAKLTEDLHASNLAGFRLLSACGKYSDNIHTGAYRLKPDDTTWQIFRRLQTGNQTPIQLNIPSVRTVGQLLRTVSRKLMTDSSSIARLLSDSAYVTGLGYDTCTIPALFIPNTYEVYWNITPKDFIRRMQKEHDRFWNEKRKQRAKEIGFTPVEVATIASIVEEETANKAEKPMVAGLYINRLHKGMLLQADPTVKFALKDFALRRILKKHLQAESPYNTYLNVGLPPGPIRIPSIEGIEAVLNYSQHDYIYMCAKEDFSGTHNFAKDWNEHLANARRYQRALNKRNIK